MPTSATSCPPLVYPPDTAGALELLEHSLMCETGDLELSALEDSGWLLPELALSGCDLDAGRTGFWAVLAACLLVSNDVLGLDDDDLPTGLLAGLDDVLSQAYSGDVDRAAGSLDDLLGRSAPVLSDGAAEAARAALLRARRR